MAKHGDFGNLEVYWFAGDIRVDATRPLPEIFSGIRAGLAQAQPAGRIRFQLHRDVQNASGDLVNQPRIVERQAGFLAVLRSLIPLTRRFFDRLHS